MSEEIARTEERRIIIKNEAFRKMISHISRFANDAVDDEYESFGLCIGRTNEENHFEILDAIPMTHGDKVELGFNEEIHEAIKEIHVLYEGTDKGIIGWYHSHLGYGLFFSDSDKSNQKYFQNDQNPYGFGIVFDASLLDAQNNFGCEIFRLKDYAKGTNGEYLKVAFDLELPNTLEYFKWIQKLVEDSQRKTPLIIKEYFELKKPLPEELQEIPGNKTVGFDEEEYDERLQPIFTGLEEGTSKFTDIFLETYKLQLTEWMKDVLNGTTTGTEIIRSSIFQMKESILGGMVDIQKYFERSLDEISDITLKNVSSYIDARIENQKALKNNVNEIFEEVSKESTALLEENIDNFASELKEKTSYLNVKLYNITQTIQKVEPTLNKIKERLADTLKETNNFTEESFKEINLLNKQFESKLRTEVDALNVESNPIQEKYKDIEELIERLQRIISDFRQLK